MTDTFFEQTRPEGPLPPSMVPPKPRPEPVEPVYDGEVIEARDLPRRRGPHDPRGKYRNTKWAGRVAAMKRNANTWHRYGPYASSSQALVRRLEREHAPNLDVRLLKDTDGRHYVFAMWKDRGKK